MSTTFLGLLAAIWPASAAETPSIQLKPQSTITALDAIADQTHGAQRARLLAATQKGNSREALGGEFDTATVLRDSSRVIKWSNGAFLYMDAAGNGVPPTFHTLNHDGSLISSTTLQIPGASQYSYAGFDRGTDGAIAFAGGTYSAYGEPSPLIAWISPDGQTQRITRTGVYFPHMISIAVYPALPAPAQGGMVDGFGLSDDGTASLSIYDPKAAYRWTTYTFDSGTSQWLPATQMAVGGSAQPRVVGADCNQLVLLSGSNAAFYSFSH